MSERPTLGSVIELACRGLLDDVRVALPGVVVSYDASKQRATIQPAIRDTYENENGEDVTHAIPTLSDVPVCFQGAGDYWQTFPLKRGDTVMLHFCSSSVARWKARGGSDVEPGDPRHHHLSDAIAVAGVRDAAHAILGVPEDAWVINVPTGKQVRLGGPTASASVIKGESFLSHLATLLTAVQTAIDSLPGGTAPAITLGLAITAFNLAAAGDLTLKVKVE